MSNNSIKIMLAIPEGVAYPTLAAVPFKKGHVFPKPLMLHWHLINGSNGHEQPSFKKIVACWPDGSVKWAQVYAVYTGGIQYYLNNTLETIPVILPPIPADDTLKWVVEVEDGDGIIWTNTPEDRVEAVLKNIPVNANGPSLISREGGWTYEGSSETKMVEIDSPVLRMTRYEGWLHAPGKEPQYRYCTRVTRYAGIEVVKLSHSIIFASSMRNKKIKHISFHVPTGTNNNVQIAHFGVDGADHTNPLTPNGQISVHQRKPFLCEITINGTTANFYRSDGYLGCNNFVLYSRNFWQKFPQQLSYTHNRLTYRQWYGKGNVFDTVGANGVIERLQTKNLHKLSHWHQGEFLENNPPKNGQGLNGEWADRFYGLMRGDEGIQEEDISYTERADMEGIAFHDEFALHTGNQNRVVFSRLWQKNPVGHCEADYIEHTRVVDFAVRGSDFPGLEQFMEDSILGFTNPERFEDFGRFIFGESHRTVIPIEYRPSLHRLMLGSYYCSGETHWMMRLRGAGDSVLQLARCQTERYASIGTVNYNKEFTTAGAPVNPEHNPGATWYRGLWWGDGGVTTPIPGINNHGEWAMRIGRIPDPDSLLWSWILDGNWNHKDAYEMWYAIKGKFVRTNTHATLSNYRGIVKELVYAMTAFDHFYHHPQTNWQTNDDDKQLMMEYFFHYTTSLLSFRMDEATGPLFHPLWISRAIDLFNSYLPDTADKKKTTISNLLSFVIHNYNSNFVKGAKTLDMAVIMMEIANNRFPFYANYFPHAEYGVPYHDFLQIIRSQIREQDHIIWLQKIKERIVLKDPDSPWYQFGIGDGELGDYLLKLQWGRFLKLLREFNLTENDFPAYRYPGFYPSSAQSNIFHPRSIGYAKGNEVLVLNEGNQPLHFNIKTTPSGYNNGGGYNPRELWIVSPHKYELDKAIHNANQKTGTHFMCLTNDDSRTEDNYIVNNIQLRLPDLQEQGCFESFTPPVHVRHFKYNWDQSNIFLSPGGTEDFTTRYSYFPTPVDIPGIYRILVDGRNVYSGIVSNHLPEAMHMIPNYNNSGVTGPAWNYIFSDSHFYLKNLSDTDTHLNLWASVDAGYQPTSGKSTAGCFARVIQKNSIGDTVKWDDLQFEGLEYGYHNDGTEADYNKSNVKIKLVPGEVIQLDVILIYESTVIRLELDGHLLCARTFQDLEAFDGYKNDIMADPWSQP